MPHHMGFRARQCLRYLSSQTGKIAPAAQLRLGLDKFYTRPVGVARALWFLHDELPRAGLPGLGDFEVIIEPSAGTGAFVRSLCDLQTSVLAYDIAPCTDTAFREQIVQLDFLNSVHRVQKDVANRRAIVVGNPPFGKNSRLAVEFMNVCATLPTVEAVAFVLPRGFQKVSVQRRVAGFSLVSSCIFTTDESTFDTVDGATHTVPSCFQLWRRVTANEPSTCKPADLKPCGWRRLPKAGNLPPASYTFQIVRAGGSAGKAFVQADRPAAIANYFIDLDDATINPRDVVATINARQNEIADAVCNVTGPRSLSLPELIPFVNRVVADVHILINQSITPEPIVGH